MTTLVPIAMFGWIPAVLLLFALLPARRAVIAAFIFAWLFLPMASYSLSGLPNYNKLSATSLGVILGVVLFDAGRIMQFRPRWIDLPMVVVCVSPFITASTNGLGLYYGLSAIFNQFVIWGLPYLIGRLYFCDAEGLRELAIGIFIGGLIYLPLCLWEVRMSPQLHNVVYGYHQNSFRQQIRFGGYRPMVFMQHGIAVGMWMTSASLIGVWLWITKAFRGVWKVPPVFILPVLLMTTILCKSLGATALLVGGLGVLFATKWTRSAIVVLCLAAVPLAYVGTRATGTWSGEPVISLVAEHVNPMRAQSFAARIEYEDMLVEKAFERPVFGWGGWGRNRVYDQYGGKITATDGLWIITFGQRGFVGLVALGVAHLLPALLVLLRFPARQWGTSVAGPSAALAVLVLIYMVDSLLNAMLNPIYTLVVGGLAGAALGGWIVPATRSYHALQRAEPSSQVPLRSLYE